MPLLVLRVFGQLLKAFHLRRLVLELSSHLFYLAFVLFNLVFVIIYCFHVLSDFVLELLDIVFSVLDFASFLLEQLQVLDSQFLQHFGFVLQVRNPLIQRIFRLLVSAHMFFKSGLQLLKFLGFDLYSKLTLVQFPGDFFLGHF